MTARGQERLPGFEKCAHCQMPLLVSSYAALPFSGPPPELVHRFYGSTHYFGVQCPACGHYTVFIPQAFKPGSEQEEE